MAMCSRADALSEDKEVEMSASNVIFSSKVRQYLQECANVAISQKISLKELLVNSNKFPIKFPVHEMMCHSLLRNRKDVSSVKLEQYTSSSYPLIHEAVFHLLINFLEYKKVHGTEKEIKLYADMGVVDLVHRLLAKRAVAFYGSADIYLLISREAGIGGWEKIGKVSEKHPLTLENCLSYDEMKLSAFLSVSSHSFFINQGDRDNIGVPASDPHVYQPDGVIIGLIGARLEKPGVMEWEEIMLSKEQNHANNGYGVDIENSKKHSWRKLWADFYGIHPNLPSYKEVHLSRDGYKEIPGGLFFNDEVYRRRVAVTAETLLLEAESRACSCNTEAYINVVGFGLGVWRISSHQEELFLETFAECIKRLFPVVSHVSVIHFLWFKKEKCGGVKNGGMICKREDGSGIKICFSWGSPHSRLDDNKLLVASYAWDGNALPGNEFWKGGLNCSGDPAEAAQPLHKHKQRMWK